MEKTATLNLRVNPELKSDAERILSRLGIPMSTAVDMFLNQVVLVGGIPFPVSIPKPSADIDISQMTEEM
ncbi:MAG: type II toxin-antitoxin system RelB/DinJ family antitoxin, partial [Clostridiales bacterium]|nr:type II toxin-antitoxin system RelB/DinJ family antitoxin [Clostridiales bacterium]